MDDCVDVSSSSDENEHAGNFRQSRGQSSKSRPEEKKQKLDSGKHRQRVLQKQRDILKDDNSKFLADFDPGSSEREKRKLARSIRQSIPVPKGTAMPNEKAQLIRKGGRDLCDCLDQTCPGCHFPCECCTSEKCGPTCRKNRKWIYEEVYCDAKVDQMRKPFIEHKQTKK